MIHHLLIIIHISEFISQDSLCCLTSDLKLLSLPLAEESCLVLSFLFRLSFCQLYLGDVDIFRLEDRFVISLDNYTDVTVPVNASFLDGVELLLKSEFEQFELMDFLAHRETSFISQDLLDGQDLQPLLRFGFRWLQVLIVVHAQAKEPDIFLSFPFSFFFGIIVSNIDQKSSLNR